MQRHAIQGSKREMLPGARLIGPARPDERFEVTLLLRRNNGSDFQSRLDRLRKGDAPLAPLSRKAFADRYGATPADIAAVTQFANAHHLAVVASSAARRTLILSGTVADFEAAFSVKLQQYDHPGGGYRGREGVVSLPEDLQNIVEAVLGLDNRAQARPHFRHLDAAPSAAPVSYAPTDVAKLYGFPEGTGAKQTIGIIELGGGSKAHDLATYFSGLGITPAPKVVSVSVDYGRNKPTGSAGGPDGEVMLDIEVAGAVAPGAKLVVYFAPNTDAAFLDAITTAVHDTTHNPSVISISWGGPESSWTAQSMTAFDNAFQDAATLGITVCVASGDDGSSDGVNDGGAHVNFPASSPHVLACGGTSLRANGGAIVSETVWNDGAQGGASGGGVSTQFPEPAWQAGFSAALTTGGSVKLTGRGVPDIAGDADPETGYKVRVDGTDTVIGGTSAVAPLWAGLIARINATRGAPVGFINPLLYANPGALNDITSGNNGTFAAASGWDATTGLGSPNGAALAKLLGSAAAGAAKTAPAGVKAGQNGSDALLVRGNARTATPKVDGDALLVRGNARLATGTAKPGKVDDDALLVRGN